MIAVLIGIAVAAMLGGAIFYNPLRRKMMGVIGVGGSYLILIGIMCLVMMIGQLIQGNAKANASATEIVITILFMIAALGYMVFVMITRCRTAIQRVMLPFAAVLIGFGFCWRFLAALVLHIPMENGKTAAKKAAFPSAILSSSGERFELENDSGDNATYYCPKNGQRAQFRDVDFEDGYPAGWYPA